MPCHLEALQHEEPHPEQAKYKREGCRHQYLKVSWVAAMYGLRGKSFGPQTHPHYFPMTWKLNGVWGDKFAWKRVVGIWSIIIEILNWKCHRHHFSFHQNMFFPCVFLHKFCPFKSLDISGVPEIIPSETHNFSKLFMALVNCHKVTCSKMYCSKMLIIPLLSTHLVLWLTISFNFTTNEWNLY